MVETGHPLISVVIPTSGRPSVRAAVESVLRQTVASVEAIVVFDGTDSDFTVSLPVDRRVRQIATGVREGAAHARAIGVRRTAGALIAFLDDDDVWVPEKLEKQLVLVESRPREAKHILVSSRVLLTSPQGSAQMVAPTRVIGDRESVPAYLFTRRRVRYGGSLLHTSTLLCDRDLALRTPWRRLSLHQDWDWVLRATSRGDVVVRMVEDPLVIVAETPNSVSRSAQWRASLEWANTNRLGLSEREWGDLLLCTTAAYAKVAGRRWQALKVAYQAFRFGRPGLPAILFFLLFQTGPHEVLTKLARLRFRKPTRTTCDAS